MAYQSEIEKLEQRYHENPQQWFAALADSYRKAGDLDLALEVVRGGLEKRPSYASGHIVLGRCLVDKQLYDEAAGVFEQVLELDAENIIALKSLGDIAEHNGDLAGAKSWLSRLLDIDPMNEEAREGMDRIHEAELAAPPEAADEASSEESPQPAIEPGAAWAAEALATMDRGGEEAAQVSVESAEPAEPAAVAMDEAAQLEPQTLEPESDVVEPSGLGDGEFAVERSSSWDDSDGASGLMASDQDMSEAVVDVEAGADSVTIEPVAGFEATVQPEEQEGLGEPGSAVVSESAAVDRNAAAVDSGEVRVAGDLEVVSFDDELSWDAGEGRSAEVSDEDVKEAESHHEDLAAPVEFLGDPGAVAARDVNQDDEEEQVADTPIDATDSSGVVPEGTTTWESEGTAPTSESRESAIESAGFDEALEKEPDVSAQSQTDSQSFGVTEGSGAAASLELGVSEEPLGEEPVSAGEATGFDQSPGVDEPIAPEPAGPDEAFAVEPSVGDLPLIMPEPGALAESASTGADRGEPVVTETMAEVFAQQGLYDQAREIYQRLIEQQPEDSRLEEKLAQLTHRANLPGDLPVASRFSVASTGGESAVNFLKGIFQTDRAVEEGPTGGAVDSGALEYGVAEPSESTVLESAFGGEQAEPPGSPTIPASDEVSLSSVFGGEPPSSVVPNVGEPSPPVEGPDSVSFDEFYGSASESPLDGGAAEESEQPDEESDDDFRNWLEGLKT
jgi:tetratricopeptide (TPR) repeat protein